MKLKVIHLIKSFFQHDLVNGSLYIILISNVGNVFVFLLNLFLTRQLTYTEFGVVTSLISFVGIVGIPSTSLTTILVQFATGFFSKKQYDNASKLYIMSIKYIGGTGFLIFLLFLFFSSYLARFLQVKDVSFVILTGAIAGVMYMTIVNNAFLQSLLKFRLLAFFSFSSSMSKVIFGVLFVLLGLKAFGVLWAVFISTALPFVFGFFPLKFLFDRSSQEVDLPKKNIFNYAIATSISAFSLSLFISTDIILTKHFFTPNVAGQYAVLALTGKIIFFLTAPISTVMFPILIKKYNQKENFISTFHLALSLVAIPAICTILFYFFFPELASKIFLGGKQNPFISHLFWMYGIYIGLYSLLNLCVLFFLSLKKTKIAYPIAIGAISQIIMIYFFHKTFMEIILISIAIIGIIFICILFYYGKYYKENKKIRKPLFIPETLKI